MPTLNAAATLEQATDFAADYASSTLTILAGATTLATHTVTSWTPSNNGAAGRATAGAIADATIANSGTANSATLTSGTRTITLSVGVAGSGADLILSTTNYIAGETSSVQSLVANFPTGA